MLSKNLNATPPQKKKKAKLKTYETMNVNLN